VHTLAAPCRHNSLASSTGPLFVQTPPYGTPPPQCPELSPTPTDCALTCRKLFTPNFHTYKLSAEPVFDRARKAKVPGGTRATNQ